MLDLYILIFALIAFFYILIKAADYLVVSSSILGDRAGISKLAIGLTIVAIGTSLPELFTSLFGLYSSDASSFVLGTVIGSNITNILLIFGILLLFSKNFKTKIKKMDIIFLFLSTVLISILVYKSKITFYDGLIFLILFSGYIYITLKNSKKEEFEDEVEEIEGNILSKKKTYLVSFVLMGSLIGLSIGARGVVYSIENIGILLNIPLQMLTLTTVALATSLPEVIVTINTARKGEYDIAIGNIIGSNISNVLLIIGTIGIIKGISFDYSKYLMSIFFLIFATLVISSALYKKNITKNYGIGFILFYLTYIVFTFIK